MTALGEAILRPIAARSVRRSNGSGHHTWEDYLRAQHDTSERLFRKFTGMDVAGKSVLEIGCGTGGRAAYLAERGAARVVGIDINAEEIAVARRLCAELYPATHGRLELLVSTEHERLDIGTFDVVVLLDTLEHVVSPSKLLRLAHGYTSPGGRCLVGVVGYYHHRGSHMGYMPWLNVFFSDETILRVTRSLVRDPDYVPCRFDSDPPIDRWLGLYDLRDRPGERLNKITIDEMKKLVRNSLFREAKLTVHGFGGSHPALRFTDVLARTPWVQELWHSYVVLEFRK